MSKYAAIIFGKTHWEILKTELASGLRLRFLVILFFPALAYIAIIFWQAHYYMSAILLFVPFYLIRWTMQSVPKAIEEIITTIRVILTIIQKKDGYTQEHCNRVALYAMTIATFCGLSEEQIEKVGRSANVHDVGKICVPDRVLKKEGGLTDEEYGEMKSHTDPHKIIMTPIPDDSPMKELIDLGRHHHERFDGKGYPDGLSGENIPIEVRIISMADAWDAMTSNRCYRKALNDETAVSEVEKNKGKQWDPHVVEACLEAHRQGALKAVVLNPDILKDASKRWQITPKPLDYIPPDHKTEDSKPETVPPVPNWVLRSYAAVLALFFAYAYFSPVSPLAKNIIVLYAVLATFLEFSEMKLPKLPRYYPAEAVYLAMLFIIPVHFLLAVILFCAILYAPYAIKVKSFDLVQLLIRGILFGVSGFFFQWLGLTENSVLSVQPEHFQNIFPALELLFSLLFWAVLYSGAMFLLRSLATMIVRRTWRLSLYWPSLKSSMMLRIILTAPIGFILMTFTVVNPDEQPTMIGALALIMILLNPIVHYFKRVAEGNPKTIEALANGLYQRFPRFQNYSNQVAELWRKTATQYGLSDEQVGDFEPAAKVSHIGISGVSDELLGKRGELVSEELRAVNEHPVISGQILSEYSFYRRDIPMIQCHHEWFDGSGYPLRLKGNAIPIEARILAVVDAFHAMTAHVPDADVVSAGKAVEKIKSQSGKQFDPKVVSAFLRALKMGKTS